MGKGGPSDRHGTTKSHRRPGCIGSGRKMMRIWPGKKMPGDVGGRNKILRGMRIVRINHKHNIIFVLGHGIPGRCGDFGQIYDTILPTKRFNESPRFFPTCYVENYEKLPEDEYAPEIHDYNDPSLSFTNK